MFVIGDRHMTFAHSAFWERSVTFLTPQCHAIASPASSQFQQAAPKSLKRSACLPCRYQSSQRIALYMFNSQLCARRGI